MTQTFWLEPTGEVLIGLRRYASGEGFTCELGYHSALNYTGRGLRDVDPETGCDRAVAPELPHDDERWPTKCESCDYVFVELDHWQAWQERLYRRTDTGEERTLRGGSSGRPLHAGEVPGAEPGAMWDASWIPFRRGADDIYLMVRCPDGHDWSVDDRASNCTMPNDDVHRCWIRHGDPRECHVTVDKIGITCAAGAGSIQTPNWHGFLRDGQLVT